MHLPRVPFFILLLFVVLLATFVIVPHKVESFDDKPSKEDLETANNNYIALLLFIQKYPMQSIKLMDDVKHKFFNDGCTVKNAIDFKKVGQLPNGLVFA